MSRYYATFGQQTAREPHPLFGRAHPDGWVGIIAPSEQEAREVAVSWLGQRGYSMLYAAEPSPGLFPLGCLATLIDERLPADTSRLWSSCRGCRFPVDADEDYCTMCHHPY